MASTKLLRVAVLFYVVIFLGLLAWIYAGHFADDEFRTVISFFSVLGIFKIGLAFAVGASALEEN